MKIDPLRERLLARELAEARALLERHRAPAVFDLAQRALADAEAARRRLDDARDTGALDVLLTTTAKEALRHEQRCEAALALVRVAAADRDVRAFDVAPAIALATTRGRWSRRIEALALLRDRVVAGTSNEERKQLAEVARALTSRDEHRWVQPAAFALLATLREEDAAEVLRERLDRPGSGDDFLVRERLVEIAGKRRHGPLAELVTKASTDKSEHVRMTAARVERREKLLASTSRSDKSPRVRAVALTSLARRVRGAAAPVLHTVLTREPDPIVVKTAARLLVKLARDRQLHDPESGIAALAVATRREDLSLDVRERLVDLLAELEVASDPGLRQAYEAIATLLESAPIEGGLHIRGSVVRRWSDAVVGRVLSVIAQREFGVAADRAADELVLYRSERRATTLWRVLYELFHPQPAKRQGHDHTSGREPRGSLRAPPAGLAELTATRVPGERVVVERLGSWGRHLPLVDDFLAVCGARAKPVNIVTSYGTTTLTPAESIATRLGGWLTASRRYEDLSALRRRSLESKEPAIAGAYVAEMTRITGAKVSFVRAEYGERRESPPDPPALPPASGATAAALAFVPVLDSTALDELWEYAGALRGNRVQEVAVYATLVLGAMLVRGISVKRSIDRHRRAMPLVVGGWGTRGKSGTERLKAGLFQGLGYECLVKTTGCEAMFIHAVPGLRASEIFIYRPYDKATVWEQRNVLALAARLDVRVFLWECMALQPDLVDLLQRQWMRDDYSTITNAYPDHEDVQGPSGYDVAECISEFVPTHGRLFTTEDQMLPLLRQRARERATPIHEVPEHASELIAEDVLARYPYREHPRNIALVCALAEELGVPRAVALAEMADNVVPDLGVLKTYPAIEHEGRRLSFTNGMSANERTGALGNWVRTGFDRHDPDEEPGRWIVTVVNNRADRLARSEVFARFVVEDIAAHRHVLIGTNVSGLVRFIDEALERHLDAISPTAGLAGSIEEQRRLASARLDRALGMLKVPRADAESVERELAALRLPAIGREVIERLLAPLAPGETYEAAKAAVEAALPRAIAGDARPFIVAGVARRRTARALRARLDDLGRLEADLRAAYRSMFRESIVALTDSALSGDQVLDRVAAAVPPNAHASIMGLQNIKGTGLDFVYRWVSIDVVASLLEALKSNARADREAALNGLAVHGDFGLLDARWALAEVTARKENDPEAASLPYAAVSERLRRLVVARERARTTTRSRSAGAMVRQLIGKTFDYLDSMRRQRMAGRVVDDLADGRITHATAASRMRAIVARQKGAWMTKKVTSPGEPEPR
jgi:gamma-polyglutamate synthase